VEEQDVVLVHSSGKVIYKAAWRGESIGTKHGTVGRKDVARRGYAKTHKGETYLILKPSLRDRIQRMRKGARPIYEYDAGVISALLSLERGDSVIEAGTGSACLTLYMASIVNPGKIYTFEREERFYEIAKENIQKSGLKNIILKHSDILKENVKIKADAVMLDMENQVKTIDKLKPNLKPGGYLGAFTPVEKDAKNVMMYLKKTGFVEVTGIQFNLKDLKTKRLFGFPGFFVVGRNF
jgi:tRNA A58 N-methylase Trm61